MTATTSRFCIAIHLLSSAWLHAGCTGGGSGGTDYDDFVLRGSVSLPPGAAAVGVLAGEDGIVYANDHYGFDVIQLDGDGIPSLAGSLTASPSGYQTTRSLLRSGNHVFSAHGSEVDVIDVSNPSAPARVTQIQAVGLVWDLALVGDRLYVSQEFAGAKAYDVTNPAAPAVVGSYGALAYAYGLAATDDMLYISSDFGVHAVSVDGGAFSPVATITAPTFYDLEVRGDYLYGLGQLAPMLLDVGDPLNVPPAENLPVNDYTGFFQGLSLVGDKLFVAQDAGVVTVVDVGSPGNPKSLGEVAGIPVGPTGFHGTGDDRFVYIAHSTGLQVFGK